MIWGLTLSLLLLMLTSESNACSPPYEDRETDFDITHTIVKMPPENRKPKTQSTNISYWQKIFHEQHSVGSQHFLIYSNNNVIFEQYVAAILKILLINSSCRITIIAPEKQQAGLRSQIKNLIIEKVRGSSSILSQLHFISDPFEKETKRSFILNNDKYTGIFLDGPQESYQHFKDWMRNQNAILYIPVNINKKEEMEKLTLAGFKNHYIVQEDQFICAATSDLTTPKGGFLKHNPKALTPVFIRKNINKDE